MKISSTIDILRDAEGVFYWLSSPDRARRWMTSVASVRILKQTEGMVGTTFEETVEEGKKSTTLRGTVAKWIPNRLIAFQLDGDYNTVDVEFQLEPAEGRTRVTQTAETKFKSITWLVMVVLGQLFRSKMVRQLESELRELKEYCESASE